MWGAFGSGVLRACPNMLELEKNPNPKVPTDALPLHLHLSGAKLQLQVDFAISAPLVRHVLVQTLKRSLVVGFC